MEPMYVFGLILLFIIALRIGQLLYRHYHKEIYRDDYESTIKTQQEIFNEKQQVQQAQTPIQPIQKNVEIYPYHAIKLLTKNEYYFYKEMKKIIDPIGLQIMAKIRLADLIEVDSGLSKAEWGKYFAKIKSKHVDFAIADNMRVIALVELDDSSHYRDERKERDWFVNNALIRSGYTVVRTDGTLKPLMQALTDKGYNLNLYTSEHSPSAV